MGWGVVSLLPFVLVLRASAGFPTPRRAVPLTPPPRPASGPPGPPTGQLLRGRSMVRPVGAVGRARVGCSIGPEAQTVVQGEAWRTGQAEPITPACMSAEDS